jgi:uncharacterized protein YdhG (YjbR/CyaY superfamily)
MVSTFEFVGCQPLSLKFYEMNEIDKYIAGFPEEMQQRLIQLRTVIRQTAPEATEKISYMMPTFYLNGNLVHFAAFKNHIGLYPAPSGIEAFKKELSAYKFAKGSVQFPHEQPLPRDLIAEIVRFRVMENSAKKKTRK